MNTLVRYIAGTVSCNSTSPSPDPGPDPQDNYPIIYDGSLPATADCVYLDCRGIDFLDGPYLDNIQCTWRDSDNGYGIDTIYEALGDAVSPPDFTGGGRFYTENMEISGNISLIAINEVVIWTAEDGFINTQTMTLLGGMNHGGSEGYVELPGLYIYGTGVVTIYWYGCDIVITKV